MFDSDRARELEKQSHVRGLLSKEFYSGEISQIDKKRKQMKRMLDEQVEERRRVKQKEKQQRQRLERQQDQKINRHIQEQAARRMSDNNSSNNFKQQTQQQSQAAGRQLSKRQQKFAETDPNQSRLKKGLKHGAGLKQRQKSRSSLSNGNNNEIKAGDMPVLKLMGSSEGQYSDNSSKPQSFTSNATFNQNGGYEFDNNHRNVNAGNIPLLDLADESKFIKGKKKSKNQHQIQLREKSDRENTHMNSQSRYRDEPSLHSGESLPQFSPSNNNSSVYQSNNVSIENDHRNSESRSMALNGLNSRATKKLIRSPSSSNRHFEREIPEQIEQMESENRQLKTELKKSQDAISLLMGAVRSNAKLDKYRVQAERILHLKESELRSSRNKSDKKDPGLLFLPKINVKNYKSIMYEYMFNAAKKKMLRNIGTK